MVLCDDVRREVARGDQEHLFGVGERMTQSRRVVIAPLPYAHTLIDQVSRTRGVADADADSVWWYPLEEVVDRGPVESACGTGDDDHLNVLSMGSVFRRDAVPCGLGERHL